MEIQTLTTSQIVALFNSVSEKPVMKFASRAVAEKRFAALLAEKNVMISETNSGVPYLCDAVDPEEDQTVEGSLAPAADEPNYNIKLSELENGPSMVQQIADAKAKREADEAAAKKGQKAPKSGSRGPAPEYADSSALSVVTKDKKNPKREGSASHARFALYFGAKTVGEFVAAGGTRADLRWDLEHGFVKIG